MPTTDLVTWREYCWIAPDDICHIEFVIDRTTCRTRCAMDEMAAYLESILPDGWETDGYGLSSNLVAPDGCVIEQDGQCSHGYVSPLRTLGLI